jgi:prepilin-type processing-associated H-X9-DG protein
VRRPERFGSAALPGCALSSGGLHRRGVTLVEIMVVAGVLAVLIGLIVPALSSTAAGGRSLRCQSNLRQMTTAANAYAALWDAFPPAIIYRNEGGVFQKVAWDWVTTSSGQVVSPGPLWHFTDNPDEVQQCPDFHGASTFTGDPHTGYNYNTSFIGAEAAFPTLGWTNVRKGVSPAACSRSCSCAMFGDGGWKGGANKFMRAPGNIEGLPLSVIYGGGQAFRHGHATNIAFVDGHVGSSDQPKQGLHQTPALLSQYMDYPSNGFLSEDDRAYDPR